jgi:L-amino acid N-acyltransferase YncA
MKTGLTIRLATEDDLEAIGTIFNHYIETSTCTFNLKPQTKEEYETWFRPRTENLPVIVADIEGTIVGYAALSQWRRAGTAYKRSVEGSVYVEKGYHRQGIGKALTVDLIEHAKAHGHRTLIGGACTEQEASLALQRSLGFESVGVFKNVGYKFDRWLHVEHTQLMLSDT